MENLEYLLWAYFICYPLYVYATFQQEKQHAIAQPHIKVDLYRTNMLHLWLPTLILLSLVYAKFIPSAKLGLQWQWHWPNLVALVALLLIAGYFCLLLKQLQNKVEARQQMLQQMEHVAWFMPSTVRESRYFIWGLSISAGICEELLFRGYLLFVLSEQLPTYMALLLSSFAFGLGHIYQGWAHVLRTMVLGAILGLIFLATDSILIPILLHAMLDMFGGAMAFKARAEAPTQLNERSAANEASH